MRVLLAFFLLIGTACADVNVADFGTDDQAIRDAMASLPNGGVLILPSEVFLSDTVVIDKRITLRGEGHTMSVGEGAPTTIYKGPFDGPGFLIESDGVVFENFYMRGEPGNEDCGIRVHAARFTARNLTISHMGLDGMRIGNSDANCNYWRLDNCYFVANGCRGLFIHSDYRNANCGVGTLIIARDNAIDGVRLGLCTGNIFHSVNSASNGQYGVRFREGAKGNVIYGGNLERNGMDAQIRFDSDTNGNVMKYMRVDNGSWIDYGLNNQVSVGLDLQ